MSILSFDKFQELLSKNGYAIVSVYESKKKVVFLELRTPKLQRSFILYVPKKYKIKSKNVRYRTFTISSSKSENVDAIIYYLSELKGALLDCDLIAISSELLCLQRNNGDVISYVFGKRNDIKIMNEERSPIDQLIDESRKIEQLLKEEEDDEEGDEIEIEGIGEVKGDEISETPETISDEIISDAEEEDIVKEEPGNEEDNIKEESENTPEDKSPTIELNFVPSKEEDVNIIPKARDISLMKRIDNSLPNDIEESNINIGLIYYCIDLSSFYKKLKKEASFDFEKEILAAYDALDDNEIELRDIKIDEISELSNKLVKKAKDISEGCKKTNLDLKTQLIRLSETLNKTEKLKIKVDTNEKKFATAKPEVDRLYNQTKTALHDINTEIIRTRESTNDILEIIRISLEELLET
ncbi:MAG TPA: hypothetical protein PKD85_01105 [Saprospiraceae bacterium]|nr:hypothetical protein [Saprospiraceae bacterium]